MRAHTHGLYGLNFSYFQTHTGNALRKTQGSPVFKLLSFMTSTTPDVETVLHT